MDAGLAKSLTATRSHELSEAQHILTEPKGGASTESDWVVDIRKKLDLAGQDDIVPSIYKVPHHLRENDDEAYVPQIVSLGPYHRGNERLLPMARYKMLALKFFLKRKNEDIKIYLDSIKELEGKARDCYEGQFNMSSEEFVWMLVLDGCFVLELISFALGGLKEQHGYGISEEFEQLDRAFAISVSMNLKLIQRDMIMLENQIPLFILYRLLGLQLGCPDQRGRVANHAVNFFSQLMPAGYSLMKSDQNIWESSPEGAVDPLLSDGGLHFLDVFRRNFLQTWPGPRRPDHANRAADKHPLRPLRCVTELSDAGVQIKKRDSHRFWDIKFKNGVLEIPRLLIDDGTKSLFLNLIAFEQRTLLAFEQTRRNCTNSFSSYVLFMDSLIDSSEDVRHLHHCGTIEHWLGNDDKVVELFDRLWRKVIFDIDNRYFSELSDEVNKYCSRRWNIHRAELQRKYFKSPWAIISLTAGALLLLLTLIQIVYAVCGSHGPS